MYFMKNFIIWRMIAQEITELFDEEIFSINSPPDAQAPVEVVLRNRSQNNWDN